MLVHHSPIDIFVGSRLRLRRIELNMSQGALGKKIGLTYQQIHKYEQGINRISASKLYYLSIYLDVPVKYFFEGACYRDDNIEAKNTSQNNILELLRKKDIVKLINAFEKIEHEGQRKSIVRLIESLVGKVS